MAGVRIGKFRGISREARLKIFLGCASDKRGFRHHRGSKTEDHLISSLQSLLNPPFPHLRLNAPFWFDPLLSPVEGKRSLGKLLVVVMVGTVDDNVVRGLGVVDISDIGHPLLVCLSSTVDIWNEDDI